MISSARRNRLGNVLALVLMTSFAVGCSRPAAGPDQLEDQPGTVDPQPSTLQRFENDCSGSQLDPDCRSLLAELAAASDPEALPVLCRSAKSACQNGADPVCRAVIAALVEAQQTIAIAALLELEAPPPQETLAGVDPELQARSMEILCEQVPPAAGCDTLVQILARAGVEAALERQRLSSLRELVAQAAAAPHSEQVSTLRRSLEQGPEIIPALLALRESGLLKGVELQLIDQTITAYGASARPYLVTAIKSKPMPVSLRAAYAGWDPAADELEDPSRLEGPKRSVQVAAVADYIGKQLRIYHKDGTLREGVLKRIDDDILYVETRIGGGVITTRIERANVDRIQF